MKNWVRTAALVLLLAAMIGLVASGMIASTSQPALTYHLGKVLRDVPYSPSVPSVKMDVYYPAGAASPVPAVVYVHGGGWYSGDKADAANMRFIMPLVAHGYVVAAVNYRLAPRFQFPAQIEDVRSAVSFLRTNAARYEIDPERIGAMGDSAGGHLVALLGLTEGGAMDSVQAVVDLYGPTDLSLSFRNGSLLLLDHVFGTDDPDSPQVKDASPVTYVSADAPPFLIVQGDRDDTVLPEQSEELYDRLEAAGARASLLLVSNAGHALAPVGGPISPDRFQITDQIVEFLDTTLAESPG